MKRLSATDLRSRLGDLAGLLSRQTPLTDADQAAIRGQWRAVSHYPSGSRVAPCQGASFLVSGWACRLRRSEGGKRQIFMFLMPGDIVGSVNQWEVEDRFEVVCLTSADLVDITPLIAPAFSTPSGAIVRAARAAERQAEACLLNHIVRLGSMDARQGLAHLLLELHARLSVAGLTKDDWFPLPIGQRPLGHAMGFSVMHVNTTLKHLRAEALIELGPGWARILDRPRLTRLAVSGGGEICAPALMSA